ncbi:MAG TPA: Gfo/Idh/MocA family oxidoreductase, partial [Thermomicrobiales bacterium]|nr:Gfo/Idh/MocA family oxidoreductase [Thermomicrobiales bacterium]
ARVVAEPLGARYTSNPNEAMAAADVDAVIVAVPTVHHRAVTEMAAKYGKHVFCEKPIALTLEDANAMVEACREAGVGLMVGHVVRFFPEYARIQQLLQDGAVGQVGVVRTRRLNLHPRSVRPWYADMAQSGGMILDLMIHDLDTLRWYFGAVKRVMAHSLSSAPRQLTVDYALAILRFETGVIAHVEGSWAHSRFRTAIEIAGSDGLIRHASDETAALTVERTEPTANASYVVPSSPLAEGPYHAELRHFFEHLEDQRFLTDGVEATRSLELALAVRTSVETGQPVHLEDGRVRGERGAA